MQGTWQEGVGDEPAVWSCTQAMRVDSEASNILISTWSPYSARFVIDNLSLHLYTHIVGLTSLDLVIYLWCCRQSPESWRWGQPLICTNRFLNQGPSECQETTTECSYIPMSVLPVDFTELIIMSISMGWCWPLHGWVYISTLLSLMSTGSQVHSTNT